MKTQGVDHLIVSETFPYSIVDWTVNECGLFVHEWDAADVMAILCPFGCNSDSENRRDSGVENKE